MAQIHRREQWGRFGKRGLDFEPFRALAIYGCGGSNIRNENHLFNVCGVKEVFASSGIYLSAQRSIFNLNARCDARQSEFLNYIFCYPYLTRDPSSLPILWSQSIDDTPSETELLRKTGSIYQVRRALCNDRLVRRPASSFP
jgi:hypothetical protein